MLKQISKDIPFREKLNSGLKIHVQSHVYDYYILTIIYFLAYGLMLFNHNGFYDVDWDIFLMPYDILINFWEEHGTPTVSGIYYTLFSLGKGYSLFKLATFLSHLFIGLICYDLLKKLDFLDRNDAFFITVLAMTFPNQDSRLISCFGWYSYHFLFFMLGFYLIRSKKVLGRTLSLCLFFISFFVNSLLVFYAVPIMYSAYKDKDLWLKKNYSETFTHLRRWVVSKIDFFLLPFAFFVLQCTIWKVSFKGAEDYNSIHFINLLTSIPKTFYAFYSGFLDILDKAFLNFSLASTIVFAIIIYNLRPFNFSQNKNKNQFLILLLIGACIFYLGAYPYFVINRLLTATDIGVFGESRDQMLILFGAAFILYFGLQFFISENYKKILPIIYSVLLATFIIHDINRIMDYQVDCAKSNAIISQLRSLPVVNENKGKSFIFRDNAKIFNINNRIYGSSELSFWLRFSYDEAQGVTPRIGFLQDAKGKYEVPDDPSQVMGTININTRLKGLSLTDKLRIVLYNVINKNRYYDFLNFSGFIELTYEPLLTSGT